MAPDRRHVHHLLEQAGLGTAAAVAALHGAAFVLGGVGVAGWRLGVPDWLMFGLGLALFGAYHLAALRFWRASGAEQPAAAAAASREAPSLERASPMPSAAIEFGTPEPKLPSGGN
jgi:UDP-GlcNAc:undecaprenyl-phosphate GlcNAc-1-phosphate transferase